MRRCCRLRAYRHRSGEIMTPEICARLLCRKLNFWYSADHLTVDANGLVSGANDLSCQGRDGVQATGANRLTFFNSDPMFGGRPSFGSTTNTGVRHLAAPGSYNTRHQFFSVYYKDGLDTTFDVYSFFTAGTATVGAPRLMGNQNTADIITSSAYSSTISKGGRTPSVTVLPLPATVCLANGNQSLSMQIGGSTTSTDRVLVGAFRHVVSASVVLTTREIALIEGAIAWSDDTQHRLIASHPYKLRPPFVGD